MNDLKCLTSKKVFLLYIDLNERPLTFGYARQKYFFNIDDIKSKHSKTGL